MRITALLTIALLALAGCTGTTPEPDAPALDPVEEASTECLGVTEATVAGVQWGVDERQSGFVVVEAIAIVNPAQDTNSWFVAAQVAGSGVRDGSVGVWYTLQDPTTAEGDSIAFMSVDAFAAEFSAYAQPQGFSSALDGVRDVEECLGI